MYKITVKYIVYTKYVDKEKLEYLLYRETKAEEEKNTSFVSSGIGFLCPPEISMELELLKQT